MSSHPQLDGNDVLLSEIYGWFRKSAKVLLGFKKGVNDSFDIFASFVDLFKKYKNNVKLLMNEQKDVWLKFVQYYETQSDTNPSNYLNRYNNWLFEYIFYDINNMSPNDFLSL